MKKSVDLLKKSGLSLTLLSGVSYLAFMPVAFAQQTVDRSMVDDEEDTLVQEVIQVTGIRAALTSSTDIKRYSEGVVDAISAEDMGKFPDTNLAESLQRITGVSISRSRGEGSQITVRGFGPDFNLVLLNGRQMATSHLGSGEEIPVSRGFDFATIASDVVSGVEVYKTANVTLPTGGIGSSVNVKTARPLETPGYRFIINAKGVADSSITSLGDEAVTPEVSAFYSNTFAENTIGLMVSAAVQSRHSGEARASEVVGRWRGFYKGNQGGWGALPPTNPTTGYPNVTNRPGSAQIYSVPTSFAYNLTNVETERTNIGLVLQYRPQERMTATVDYFTSELDVKQQRSDVSVWFWLDDKNASRTAIFGDGPIPSLLFYSELGNNNEPLHTSKNPVRPNQRDKDFSMGASKIAVLSEFETLGFNFTFESDDGFEISVDAHTSTSKNKPNSPYGSGGVIGTADRELIYQEVDFRNGIPAVGVRFNRPDPNIDAAKMQAQGSVFHDSRIETTVEEYKVHGTYEFDDSLIRSVDFGVSTTTNDYQGSHNYNQRNTWDGEGAVGTPADFPDDIWKRTNLSSNFDQFAGHENILQDFFIIDFDKLFSTLDKPIGTHAAVCGGDGNCLNDKPVETSYKTNEETLIAFIKVDAGFENDNFEANLTAGLRLERTTIDSSSLVATPTNVNWVAGNEFVLVGVDDKDARVFDSFSGVYEFALPNVNLSLMPTDEVVLRASWGKSLTRPNYKDIKGGRSVDSLVRANGGTGSYGDPSLKPYISTNTDVSAEWYYESGSYLSVAYFSKKVENYIATRSQVLTPYNIYTPYGGKRYNDAVAALGGTPSDDEIRQWIFRNVTDSSVRREEIRDKDNNVTGYRGDIFGVPGDDPLLQFTITGPVNLNTNNVDGWEFAWQHFFGDSGFGLIANYTIVGGDGFYDDLKLRADTTDPQTPIPGLADSYNLIGFYDKNGLQIRLAHSWRDKVLTGLSSGDNGETNPQYTEDYGQFDFSSSFLVAGQYTVFLEGINVTNETDKAFQRSPGYPTDFIQNGSRYFFGVRYSF